MQKTLHAALPPFLLHRLATIAACHSRYVRTSPGSSARAALPWATARASWPSSTSRPTASPATGLAAHGPAAQGIAAGIAAAIAAHDAGADILDLGAESTRPGAEPLSPGIEQARLLPVLEGVLQARPAALISVDTYHSSTALAAAAAGAEIINDVSGLTWDTAMAQAIVDTRCGLVLMHTRGRSWEWKTQPRLALADVVPTVLSGLQQQMASAQAAGIRAESLVLDPGFGFGKLGRENFAPARRLRSSAELRRCRCSPASRARASSATPSSRSSPPASPPTTPRRTATTAANVAAILAGAHILRVHEVQPAREAAAIADACLL